MSKAAAARGRPPVAAAPSSTVLAADPMDAAGPSSTFGSDTHTSADYYVDSYSHFGTSPALRGALVASFAAAVCCVAAALLAPPVPRDAHGGRRHARAGIHEEMLKDTVRTKTYQQAICNVRLTLPSAALP
jgi:hypothetical protein